MPCLRNRLHGVSRCGCSGIIRIHIAGVAKNIAVNTAMIPVGTTMPVAAKPNAITPAAPKVQPTEVRPGRRNRRRGVAAAVLLPWVAGIGLLRQRPGTARGITFVTLEDETGLANLVIRPNIWDQYYQVARRSPAWIAHVQLESREGMIHLVVNRLEDFSVRMGNLRTTSRDFH